jgi:putative flippase GtrA/LmbE family N-acetylglucosaminyl deacetylase
MKALTPPKRSLVAIIRGLLQKKTIRYLIVGGTVYLFELWVIIVAQDRGASATTAVALSFTLGLIVSFFLQKLFTFRDKRMHHKVVLAQAVAVGLLVVWNLCFTLLLTSAVQSFMQPTVARTIALLITTIWNFYLYKTRIFTAKPQKKVPTEHPGVLLRFDMPKVASIVSPPKESESALREERQHSFRIVVLCTLLLLALVSGGQVTATLQHAIARSAEKHVDTLAPSGPRPEPLHIDGLSSTGCRNRTILQVVAHADDDLAFINPDTQTAISKGKCVRTVYLTAADHGWGITYTEEREMGIRAAYSVMLNTEPNDWKSHDVTLPTGETLRAYDSPDGTPTAATYFLRLPDGNLDGNGFATTGHVSLRKLLADPKLAMTTLDMRTTYTRQSLVKVIAEFIAVYQPVEVRTLGDYAVDIGGDHSDHVATGELTAMALKQYRRAYHDTTTIPLIKYIGYPIAGRQSNLSDSIEEKKAQAFFAYARYDYNVCKTMGECQVGDSSYAKYLSRRYTLPSK